jgi:hypothetical protein
MKIKIEFTNDGYDWEKGDKGMLVKLINKDFVILAVIILNKNGKFVTSHLHENNFKGFVY